LLDNAAPRIWFAFALVLAVLMTGFLVGPRSPAAEQEKHCVANLVTSSPFGLSLGCDAFHNLDIGRRPWRLLEKGEFRQSRPLLAIPAYLLRPLFLWARDAPQRLGIRAAPDIREYYLGFVPSLLANDFPAWLAYVLVNVLELAAAFAIYLRLVLGSTTGRSWSASSQAVVAVGAIGLLLIANDVVKAFVFNAHVQMFNILAPLLGVLVLARPAGGAGRAALVGVGAGVGILAYPLMVVVAACYGLRAVYDLYRERDLRAFVVRGALVGACTAIPVLGWYWFVLWYVGSFYSDAVQYRQLIWIADSFKAGTLIVDIARFFGGLIREAILQAGALAAMFALAIWLGERRIPARLRHADRELIAAGLVICLVVWIFHALAGFTMARVAYGLLPPLIVVCGVLARAAFETASPLDGQRAAIGFSILIAVQAVYTMVKAGPYG
jgi:hypothetical protein